MPERPRQRHYIFPEPGGAESQSQTAKKYQQAGMNTSSKGAGNPGEVGTSPDLPTVHGSNDGLDPWVVTIPFVRYGVELQGVVISIPRD